MYISDADIRQAVHRYCLRTFSADLAADPPFVFSERHIQAMKKLLSSADRRRSTRRAVVRTAACIAAALVIFVAACIASPRVWAAVRSWYTRIISPDMLVYEFEHEENDHAFLVVRPEDLPEGLKLADLDEGDGYSNQVYTSDTGTYLKFSYHWATVKELKTIDRLEKKYGNVSIYMGQQAVAYADKNQSKLVWYDKYSKISYWAEGNIDLDALIEIFSKSIEIHPPVYEPAWLPEGYVVYDIYIDKGESSISYLNEDTQIMISIESADLGVTDGLFVYGDGVEDPINVVINGHNASVYSHKDGPFAGTDIVVIDESSNMVYTIQTGITDLDTVVKIAGSLEKVETFSRYFP